VTFLNRPHHRRGAKGEHERDGLGGGEHEIQPGPPVATHPHHPRPGRILTEQNPGQVLGRDVTGEPELGGSRTDPAPRPLSAPLGQLPRGANGVGVVAVTPGREPADDEQRSSGDILDNRSAGKDGRIGLVGPCAGELDVS
jgi:hypothetical protein